MNNNSGKQSAKNVDLQEVVSPSGDEMDESELVEVRQMTLWETTQSVLFAMLGVQNSKNAKRDFSKGKASHFIVIGVAFGILFVLSVALAVNLILSSI